MTKLTAAGLAPALALALISGGGARLRHALVAGGATVACALPWLALNEVVYHAPTPAAAAHQLSAIAPAATPAFLAESTLHAFITFWSGQPIFTLPLAQAYCLIALVAMALAAAGLWRLYRWTALSRPLVWVLVVAVLGEAVAGVAAPVVAQAAFLAPGRYLYPALAPALALLAAGLWAELRQGRAATLGVCLFSAIGLGMVTFYAAGLPPTGAHGPREPAAQAQRISVQGGFRGVNVMADEVARDSASAWLHVRYSNGGADAEWTPVPVVTADDTVVGLGDYPRSSPMPGWLAAGAAGEGWIRLNMDRDAPRDVNIRFLDIATDGYTEVGSVTLSVQLP
jgi:hypothetical protein